MKKWNPINEITANNRGTSLHAGPMTQKEWYVTIIFIDYWQMFRALMWTAVMTMPSEASTHENGLHTQKTPPFNGNSASKVFWELSNGLLVTLKDKLLQWK